jgi:serine/threonine-protein kinase
VTEQSQTDPMIGRLLDGRYEVRSRIARGGMATVYLATDLRLERRVAVKVMHGHLADDAMFRERFIREARSAARLAHPNVVNVFDQGQDLDMAYLVMEYLPGITLRELLQEHKSLTTEQTLDVMEAVLAGLAAAHKAGIVHRDLKPENVLLADDGRIKIGDFGLARATSANTATGAALLGTIAYLSPELVTRGVADARSDIYAAGIMMYEMLTGEQPYKGDEPVHIAYQHANDSVPAPSTRNPRVPAELDELVLWATSKNPDERPADAREFLDQLFETHSALMTAHPGMGADTGQRTSVLPALPLGGTGETTVLAPARGSTAETQVIGPRGSLVATGSTAGVSTSTAALALRSGRRRKRWPLVLAIVLILALAAGAAGLYFGIGPGSNTQVPTSIAGLAPDDARAQLTELGFTVAEATGQINDPEIQIGLVAESEPAMGETVQRGATVTLLLSIGPRSLPLPEVVGLGEAEARDLLKDFRVADESIGQFNDGPAGVVLDVLAADGVTSLAGTSEYGERQPLTLVVSVGNLPDVANTTPETAASLLDQAGVSVGRQDILEYSDTVEAGVVIRAQSPDGLPIRVGGVVDLVISQGPQLFTIPDVIGMTWLEARQVLESVEGANFVLSYNSIFDLAPSTVIVTNLNPGAGEAVRAGTTIAVSFGG